MRQRTIRLRRLVWPAGLVALLAFGSYAFTASLSVPTSAAAEGAGTAQVSADAGAHWQSCSQGAITAGAASYTCVFGTEPTTAAVTNLEVAVAN